MPGLPVQIFDARLKAVKVSKQAFFRSLVVPLTLEVASEEGIEVLCDLLKDPLEAASMLKL